MGHSQLKPATKVLNFPRSAKATSSFQNQLREQFEEEHKRNFEDGDKINTAEKTKRRVEDRELHSGGNSVKDMISRFNKNIADQQAEGDLEWSKLCFTKAAPHTTKNMDRDAARSATVRNSLTVSRRPLAESFHAALNQSDHSPRQ